MVRKSDWVIIYTWWHALFSGYDHLMINRTLSVKRTLFIYLFIHLIESWINYVRLQCCMLYNSSTNVLNLQNPPSLQDVCSYDINIWIIMNMKNHKRDFSCCHSWSLCVWEPRLGGGGGHSVLCAGDQGAARRGEPFCFVACLFFFYMRDVCRCDFYITPRRQCSPRLCSPSISVVCEAGGKKRICIDLDGCYVEERFFLLI